MPKHVYFITGASGVGKTTLVEALKKKYASKNWAFLHFDSVGVPSLETMEKEYGSGTAWQEATTYQWIDTLLNTYPTENICFEGQTHISFIQKGFAKHNFTHYTIILIDCDMEEMERRLIEDRNQSELVTEDMRHWLKFLREQAREMGIPSINTHMRSQNEVLSDFKKLIDS